MRHIVDADEPSVGLGRATLGAIRRSVGTRARQWLVAVTLLLGLTAAAAIAAGAPPDDRTFAKLSDPVQSLMSVMVPLLGILLTRDLRRVSRAARLIPTLLAATLLAAAVGVFGILVCAAALAAAPASTAQDPWRHAGTIALGSVLVQVVAQLVGTGLGLLLRAPVVAFVASIVLPLGLWFLLGAVDVLRPAQWLTPYAMARQLLSGQMSAVDWVQWLVVLLSWGAGLNAVGAARRKRWEPDGSPKPAVIPRSSGAA